MRKTLILTFILLSLDPLLLYSVSISESGFAPANKKVKQPWPWAVCSSQGSFFAASKKDAEIEVARLKKMGIKSVDVGLMQVNLLWHSNKINHKEMFDPGDLVTGIGRYHNWSDSGRQARYALKVLKTYKQLSRQR